MLLQARVQTHARTHRNTCTFTHTGKHIHSNTHQQACKHKRPIQEPPPNKRDPARPRPTRVTPPALAQRPPEPRSAHQRISRKAPAGGGGLNGEQHPEELATAFHYAANGHWRSEGEGGGITALGNIVGLLSVV